MYLKVLVRCLAPKFSLYGAKTHSESVQSLPCLLRRGQLLCWLVSGILWYKMWGTKRLETAEKWAQRVQLVYLTRIERHGVGGGDMKLSAVWGQRHLLGFVLGTLRNAELGRQERDFRNITRG